MGAFNGSGIFIRSYSWQQDAANAIDIDAGRMDTEDNGFAAGFNNCVTRDGQGKPGADFLPGTDNVYALGNGSFRWASFNGISAGLITPVQAVKAATTPRSSTTTAADDPDLALALGVGTWRIEAQIFCNALAAGATPGLKIGYHFSGTCNTTYWQVNGSANGLNFNPFVVSMSGGANQNAISTFAMAASPSLDCLTFIGTLPVTVAGTLALFWAQFNSSGNATQILLNSYLTARRLA